MTKEAREHPVRDHAAHAHAVSEYVRDNYTIREQEPGVTVVERADGGSLLTHLALFFTVGWVSLGLLNWWYARRRRWRTRDRVRVVTQG